MSRFALHGRGDIGNLVCHGLERRPGDMRPVRATRKAENRAACFGVPVRRSEACERRNHHDARRIGDAVRKVFAFGSILNNAELVSKPLHHSARHEHAAFKGVFEPIGARSARGDRSYQAVLRFNGGMARMEQHKTTRAVRILRATGVETALAEQGRLLVARNAANRNAGRHGGAGRYSKVARRGTHLGKKRCGHVEQLEQLFVPLARMDVEEHRAARVGHVGRMHCPTRKLPNEPRINRAERKLAGLCRLARAGNMVEQPLDFARREIRIGNEARFCLNELANARPRAHFLDDVGRTAALPHDGIGNRSACLAIPNHRSFTLIRNANRVDFLRHDARRNEYFGYYAQLG